MFRLQYYKLIEECITQIVLQRGGVDPDFRHTKRFEIDVGPLIGLSVCLLRYLHCLTSTILTQYSHDRKHNREDSERRYGRYRKAEAGSRPHR